MSRSSVVLPHPGGETISVWHSLPSCVIYGNTESIHTIAWKGFSEKDPFAAELLGNIRLTDAEISSLMTALEEAQTTERQAARQWMEEHQELVNSWIPEKD